MNSPNRSRLTRSTSTLALTLALASTTACGHRAAPAPDVAQRPLPPPTRPDDVLVSAHFGQPRATVDALSQLVGSRIPFELGLALALGVDGTVLAASDTSRPIDLFVTGTIDHPAVVFVLTPAAANQFRNTLSSRFRLVRVETLGERLDPQNANARAPARGTRCAIVGVPGPVPSRLVCASGLEALEHAGRFAAYESQRLAEQRGDVLVDVDGATARSMLGPFAQRAIDENNRSLAAAAADERRRHEHPPDLGDPEAALTTLTGAARSLVRELDDLRHFTLRGTATAESAVLEADVTLDATGRGMAVADALSRVGIDLSHPLASRLAADAFAAFVTRSHSEDRASLVDAITGTVVAILGTRVSDPTAAQRDLNAVFAQLGDETAASVAHEPDGGFEFTALFSQRDDGTAARAALATLARAPWLRAARFGDTAVSAAYAHDVLTLRTNEPHPSPAATAHAGTPADAGAAPEAAPTPPPTVAVAVVGNTLAVIVGHHVDTAVAALTARTSGPAPAVLGDARGSVVAAMDLTGVLRGTSPEEHPTVRATYAVDRDGASVIAHGRVVLPPAVVRSALRGALQPSR